MLLHFSHVFEMRSYFPILFTYKEETLKFHEYRRKNDEVLSFIQYFHEDIHWQESPTFYMNIFNKGTTSDSSVIEYFVYCVWPS